MRTLSFTLDDFLEQLGQVRQLGPLDELLGMLPGANKIKGLKNAQVDEKQIGHIEAIIRSMTKLEREQPEIINASRKSALPKVAVQLYKEINRLIKQFDDMKK